MAIGRPKIKLDEELLQKLASIGCTDEEIATHLGCSTDTLTRNYAHVLKLGKANMKISLRRFQFKGAQNGNSTMQIWLGKMVLGQKEIREYEPGNPMVVQDKLDKIADALQSRDG